MTLNLDHVNTVLAIVCSLIVLGGAFVGLVTLIVSRQLQPVRANTRQLEHNGGTHVADYARDSRDLARDASSLARLSLAGIERIERRMDVQDELIDGAAESARAAENVARQAREAATQAAVALDEHVQALTVEVRAQGSSSDG